MITASARLLALLGHLRSRRICSGTDLCRRLDVTDRTLRKDIERLRELGYPIESVRGPGGGYALGRGGALPPLLLDDEEAVAVAVSLGAATGIRDVGEIAARAQRKLEDILPSPLRRRVHALREAVSTGPENTQTDEPEPQLEPGTLTAVAVAIRDRQRLRFVDTRGEPHDVEPYRLVSWKRRWYVVARDPSSDRWSSHRLDRVSLRDPGPTFVSRPLPGGDYTAFVLREVASSGWAVRARIEVDAPADVVLERINPTVGVVEALGPDRCALLTGADTLETVALYIGLLGLDFHVEGPPELIGHLTTLGNRYLAAVPSPERA